MPRSFPFFFFFNDTATTEIYTLSLHDALPIYAGPRGPDPVQSGDRQDRHRGEPRLDQARRAVCRAERREDRKSTRLNSSHVRISYAVFCLKKKKKKILLSFNLKFENKTILYNF